jgi:putative glutamine amidotransferase
VTERPLVVVTAIPRMVETTLPGRMPNATAHRRFGELIAAAGGVPVVAEASADPAALAARADAFVVNGGIDIDAGRYGAVPLTTDDEPDTVRDEFEFELVRAAVERGRPVLGVCRGLHVLNVALGGTLVQHLPTVTDTPHYVREPYDAPAHAIELARGSAMAAALGGVHAQVNSVHHQAADRLGAGLRATAWAPDGTVEAVEDASGTLLGVQWHPEFLAGDHAAAQVGIFRALLEGTRAAPRDAA